MDRRTFLQVTPAGAMLTPGKAPVRSFSLVAGCRQAAGSALLEGGSWFEAAAEGDGMEWRGEPGSFAGLREVRAQMLVDDDRLVVFVLRLHERDGGTFRYSFGALPQASFELVLPVALLDLNTWMADRQGAFLKPISGGDRIDLARVDRVSLTISRKPGGTVRWTMTPLEFRQEAGPAVRRKAVLPKGPLLDPLGQYRLKDWPGKTRSADELVARLRKQQAEASGQKFGAAMNRWGGWKQRRLSKGSGFFSVQHDGKRWWLVDPDGCAFWSNGPDCVRVDTEARIDGLENALEWAPEPQGEYAAIYVSRGRGAGPARSINYLAANFIRAFGAEKWRERWAEVALAELRRLNFNTVGNWSEWEYAKQAAFPYVRPLAFRPAASGVIFRDFPDVYHPGFASDVAALGRQLAATATDPALLGYFLMNEPNWGFASELPAVGMLYVSPECAARTELARWLRQRHDGDAALQQAWGMPVNFAQIARGRFTTKLSDRAKEDLRGFSVVMVERYFKTLSAACKSADPNHLNLGMRWAGVPPDWAVEGMKTFDVFSINCYMDKLPRDRSAKIREMTGRPVLVGEWHFGALDRGLPASGIGHLATQEDRAKAYRVYLEDAVANPDCVGAHWFTLYDQSALGRFDGENYNIGFLDVCNGVYEEMERAALASHGRLYEVASGATAPFEAPIKHLPRLFL